MWAEGVLLELSIVAKNQNVGLLEPKLEKLQGPVVQSIVSLRSSLRGQLLSVL